MATNLLVEFQSRKNKSTLWKFMMENNFFEGIDNTYSNDIKAYFEQKVIQMSSTLLPTDSLVNLNKQVISDMMVNNLKYKGQQAQAQGQQAQAQGQQAQAQVPPIVTAGDITEQRQKVFNKVLESKQSEFNSLMNKTVPDKIDFSDAADKPLGSEMDRMIADTIKWREKELNVVLQSQDQTEATKWINRDQTDTPVEKTKFPVEKTKFPVEKTKFPVEKTKFIKIGQSTILDNIVDLKKNEKQKHVSWGSTMTLDDDPDNFLSMLKQKPDVTLEEIKTMLIEIIDNQKIILKAIAIPTAVAIANI
jgi:hypothetical protein